MAVISSTIVPSAGLLRVPPALAGEAGGDLPGLDDRELLALAASLPASSERRAAARDLLVSRYRPMVLACVRRYSGTPEPAEDMIQVGYVGLLKAINNFDPGFGFGLSSYARSCILGEIKRHFRDRRWQVHVERPVQERIVQVQEATARLSQQLGRVPADQELAFDLGVREGDIRDVRLAELARQPRSLDMPFGGRTGAISLADLIGEEDPRIEQVLGMQAVSTHWNELPVREQKILFLRFYRDMTQVQVGRELGISQMHVSRLLAHALGYLRPLLTGMPDTATAVRRVPAGAHLLPQKTGELKATRHSRQAVDVK